MEAEPLHARVQLLLEKVGFAFVFIFNLLLCMRETQQLVITSWKISMAWQHDQVHKFCKFEAYYRRRLLENHWLPSYMHVQ